MSILNFLIIVICAALSGMFFALGIKLMFMSDKKIEEYQREIENKKKMSMYQDIVTGDIVSGDETSKERKTRRNIYHVFDRSL